MKDNLNPKELITNLFAKRYDTEKMNYQQMSLFLG